MSNHNDKSRSEKTLNSIQNLFPGKVFKSYRELCEFFGVKATGGNSKVTFLTELSRYCVYKNKGNKFFITKVFTFPLPKIDDKFLKSWSYPICGYLLLKFLSEEYISYGSGKPYCIRTKREIMKIMSLCSSGFSDYYYNLNKYKYEDEDEDEDEEEPVKSNEFYYFIEIASAYLHKKTDRILDSLESRSFINYRKIYMVKQDNTYREATDEESKKIDDYYIFIIKEYNMKNKHSIRLSQYRAEIHEKFRKHFDFKFYSAIKFELTENLEFNAGYLFNHAKLNEKCGLSVNTIICNKIEKLVLNGFIKLMDEKNKERVLMALFKEIGREEFNKRILNSKMNEEIFNVEPKIITNNNFSPEDDILRKLFKELTEQFIKIIDPCRLTVIEQNNCFINNINKTL